MWSEPEPAPPTAGSASASAVLTDGSGGAGRLGAAATAEGGARFLVWAPAARAVTLRIGEGAFPLRPFERGYHGGELARAGPGTRYFFQLDGGEPRPDPASRSQPEGVHGPSEIVDARWDWTDSGWRGIALRDYVIYELHVGTFTPEGTFDAIIPHLGRLRELGISAIELMPLAQFPGARNWGYDGVLPFAVQNSYGGPAGLRRLVDAAHAHGVAVVLDVVYNHFGPEGNYLAEFGPYFTDRYRTPWGTAVNFDGPDSDEVRRFFLENALHWIEEHHIDALRLDAVHAIHDESVHPFLQQLAELVHERAEALGRRVHLIAESDRNDPRTVRPTCLGGLGLDAQWSDDFHHALHALLTGERSGYYEDFGRVEHLARAFREGFVYAGDYSPFRRRRHGGAAHEIPAERLVVCTQNHDQVGNRLAGERLSVLVPTESLKLAAAALLLCPATPLLFMGEEYGERAPFPYFVSHSDPELIEAVRRGRQEEFASFEWQGEVPDPQAEETFRSAKLEHDLRTRGAHETLYRFYGELLRLRAEIPALRAGRERLETWSSEEPPLLVVRRRSGSSEVIVVLHFGPEPSEVRLPLPDGRWIRRLDSADREWQGEGSSVPARVDSREAAVTLAPRSALLLVRVNP